MPTPATPPPTKPPFWQSLPSWWVALLVFVFSGITGWGTARYEQGRAEQAAEARLATLVLEAKQTHEKQQKQIDELLAAKHETEEEKKRELAAFRAEQQNSLLGLANLARQLKSSDKH